MGIPIKMVPKVKLDAITLKNHQGIVAFLSPITYQPLEEIVMGAYERGETPVLLQLTVSLTCATWEQLQGLPNVLAYTD